MSVEQGRDAAVSRHSIDSNILGIDGGGMDLDLLSNKSRGASEHPFGPDIDIDFGMDMDLGLNFGDGQPLTDREKTPGQTRSSRACK